MEEDIKMIEKNIKKVEDNKAIEYVKEFIEELQCDINMFGFEDDCEEEQNLLVEERDNFKIILNLIEKLEKENKRYKSENETLKCSIAVANKLEELIKEDFIPKGKIVDIIEKISVYKKLAKESMEQGILIADSDSLEYGRMQAHNADMSLLQELLESEETNDKNNKKR